MAEVSSRTRAGRATSRFPGEYHRLSGRSAGVKGRSPKAQMLHRGWEGLISAEIGPSSIVRGEVVTALWPGAYRPI